MISKIIKATGLIAVMAFGATSAQSATVSANSVLGFQSSNSQRVEFDINSVWNGSDIIYGARISGTFRDDSDRTPAGTSQIQTGSRQVQVGWENYDCGFHSSCRRPIFETVPVYSTVYRYFDSQETATLRIGSQFETGSSGYYQTGIGSLQETRGYSGTFRLDMILDTANLADLMADGMLSSLFIASGDFFVQGLDLQFFAQSAPPTPSVPLPASAAFLLAGLGGFAVVKRKAKT